MNKFAVFDIDGTLIRWQLYHAIADALARQGQIDPASYKAIREARMVWKRRLGGSFRDYELQVIKTYEAVLKTLTFEQFEAATEAVFEEYKDQVYTYTRELIEKLKTENYTLLAISGSQTEIVAKIADYYGFKDYVGTVYERGDKSFTGAKTIGSRDKDQALKRMVEKHSLDFSGSLGIGDGHSDVSMLELVDTPIAFNPEKALFDHASQQGWIVVVERKNMVYDLEIRDGNYQLVKTDG
jgi:HAD superfamily hydrolase (TIGR01490 family)